MADLIVHGGFPIGGKMKPSGNKNAALPMICATLLTDEKVTLTNVPDINDVNKIVDYFRACGSWVDYDRQTQVLKIKHKSDVAEDITTAELPVGIRSSVLLLAPMMMRNGGLVFDTDTRGCALGIREIDPHIEILQRFGIEIESEHPFRFNLPGATKAQTIWAEYASVTSTETFAMMAAATEGTSTLINAACEPHVRAVCVMLQDMGANVTGLGTSRLEITGAAQLSGTKQRIPDDHHEVATFLAIGGVTGTQLTVETNLVADMTLILNQFSKLGMQFEIAENKITVTSWSRKITQPLTRELMPKIEAAPWPYFPADLLPQAIGIAVGCDDSVMFWNKIYEGALGWSSELAKFGTRVHLSDPHRLIVFGSSELKPAVVEAPYIIRVVLGLFLTAIQINGQSVIRNADPIRRAHANFVEKLTELGAKVEWA